MTGLRSLALIDLPLLLFGLIAALSLSAAHEPAAAAQALIWLSGGIGVALIVGHLTDDRLRKAVVSVLTLAGAAVATYFIAQYGYLQVDAKISSLDALGRLTSGVFPRFGVWSPFSNSVATCLEGLVLLAAGTALGRGSRRSRYVPLAAASLMAVALALTMSRGAWTGVAAGAAVWALTHVSSRRVRGAVAASAVMAAVVLGVAMTFPAGLDRVASLMGVFGGEFIRPDRFYVYNNSLTLLNDVGVTGLGPGAQFAQPFARFALLIQVPFVTYPHHLTMHLWLAYGLCGVVAWVWWTSGLAVGVASAEGRHRSPCFRGAWAGLIAVLVHGLTDGRQAVDPWTWGPIFVLGGLIASHVRRSGADLSTRAILMPIVCALLVGGAGIWRLMPLTAAWQTNQGIIDEAKATFTDQAPRARAMLFASAIQHYQHAVQADPQRVGARRRLALLMADGGRFDEAFRQLGFALERDQAAVATRKATGFIATWAGDLDLGRTLLAGLPGSGDELTVWSAAWEDRGQLVAARNSLRVAVALTPGYAPASEERLKALEKRTSR